MGEDGAGEFVGADVREGRGEVGHLAGGEDGVGVAVGGCGDFDEDVVGGGRGGERCGEEGVGFVVGGEGLGAHLGRE